MNRNLLITAGISLLCLCPNAAYTQEVPQDLKKSQYWAQHPLAPENLQKLDSSVNVYAFPSGKVLAQAQGATDNSSPEKSSLTPPVGENPWDKYDSAPESSKGSDELTPPVVTGNKSGVKKQQNNKDANPWDKYGSGSEEESAPNETDPALGNTEDLPPVTGENPWDKYIPVPAAKDPGKDGAKTGVDEKKPAKAPLKLAQPLKVPPVPNVAKAVFNKFPINKDYFYAMDYNGTLVGYCHYKIQRLITLGGSATFLMESFSRIKIGQENVQDLKFSSRLQFDKKTLIPTSFLCVQSSKDADLSVNCIYSKNLIAQQDNMDKTVKNHVQDTPDGSPHLVFNVLWGQLDTFADHYWLLVNSAINGGVIDTYDPVLKTTGKVVVYKPVKEQWTSPKGAKQTTYLYRITDLFSSPLAYVRLNDKRELLEINEIGSGLNFRRSDVNVVGKVDKSKGVVLLDNEISPSNVYFSDPEKLTTLDAEVDIKLRGGQLALHEIPGYKQEFYGTVKEGSVKGVAKVRTSLTESTEKSPFPFTEPVPEEIRQYLKNGPGIEKDNTDIQNKARQITWKAENSFQAARRIAGFISNQIKLGVSLPSATGALANGVASSDAKALLMTAMLRAQGIPCRKISGIVFFRGEFIPHSWVEAWLGEKESWTPFDPTLNESGFLNATHIALAPSGDIQSLKVKVDKFAPHPPRRVPFFARPLNWPIGEKRSYAIMKNGVRLGTEVAHMYDMEVKDNDETYRLISTATLNDEAGAVNLKSDTRYTSNGLPLSFSVDVQDKGKTSPAFFTFENGKIVENTKTGGKEVKREIPSSVGTYLGDQRFFSQWALIAEQINLNGEEAPKSKTSVLSAPETSAIVDVSKNTDSSKDSNSDNSDKADNLDKTQSSSKDSSSKSGSFDDFGEDSDTFTFHVFIPETLRDEEIVLHRRDTDEEITLLNDETVTVTCLEGEKGMNFYINPDTGKVVKITLPSQQLEAVLEKSEFVIE